MQLDFRRLVEVFFVMAIMMCGFGVLAGFGKPALVTWNTSSNRVDVYNEKARRRHAEATEARVLRAKRMQDEARRVAVGRE